MKKKKLISILLVVAMMFSIMPTAVLASDSDENNNLAKSITVYLTVTNGGMPMPMDDYGNIISNVPISWTYTI